MQAMIFTATRHWGMSPRALCCSHASMTIAAADSLSPPVEIDQKPQNKDVKRVAIVVKNGYSFAPAVEM
jgi:hypothetical protein